MIRQREEPWDSDPLKHHIRLDGWLPACRERLKLVKKANRKHCNYFTFCGRGAKDVLVLNRDRIVPYRSSKGFSTVAFFELDPDAMRDASQLLWGANPFEADFLDVMDFPDDPILWMEDVDELSSNRNIEPGATEFREQQLKSARRRFLRLFPFDIINLDLCGHVFRANDPLPGKVIQAIRKVLACQCRSLIEDNVNHGELPGFTLMFTTEVGPMNLGETHTEALSTILESNMEGNDELRQAFIAKTQCQTASDLLQLDRLRFLALGTCKLIARELLNSDWYFDPDELLVFELVRPATASKPAYKMLHLVGQVVRQSPIQSARIETVTAAAVDAYEQVVRQLFEGEPVRVSPEDIESRREVLEADLKAIEETAKEHGYFTVSR